MNIVVLTGTLSRDPEEKVLDSGARLVRYEVTTRDGDGRADTVPVAWLDAPARAAGFRAGDEVVVRGRVRRRWFKGRASTESRTEVAAAEIVAARPGKRARAVVERALAEAVEPGEVAASPPGLGFGP